jgi:D-amino-acid oxidase
LVGSSFIARAEHTEKAPRGVCYRRVVQVGVLGGGVSGLTCAALLRLRGHDVTLVAERLPPHTTSNIAAAFWYPYKAEPRDRVLGWARTSHTRFVELAAEPDAGVRVRDVVEVVPSADRPWWADAVPSLRPAPPERLPPGAAHGWSFAAPVIDTRTYLPWLRARFERLGGTIDVRRCNDLRDVEAAVIVNCTGLGARELCGDDALVPIRGQLVYVANPGIDIVLLDEGDPTTITYVVPRGDDCVLGGTTLPGVESLEHDPAAAASILARTAVLEPRLAGAHVIGHAVGLRPGRITVRLEAERLADGRTVVHDYGHGGAGVTLSWGCAHEVCALVEAAG